MSGSPTITDTIACNACTHTLDQQRNGGHGHVRETLQSLGDLRGTVLNLAIRHERQGLPKHTKHNTLSHCTSLVLVYSARPCERARTIPPAIKEYDTTGTKEPQNVVMHPPIVTANTPKPYQHHRHPQVKASNETEVASREWA